MDRRKNRVELVCYVRANPARPKSEIIQKFGENDFNFLVRKQVIHAQGGGQEGPIHAPTKVIEQVIVLCEPAATLYVEQQEEEEEHRQLLLKTLQVSRYTLWVAVGALLVGVISAVLTYCK